MRRRHVQTVQDDERPTLLLMAAGAVAGAAAGLYLGRRYRTMDAFLEDMRGHYDTLRAAWLEGDEIEDSRRRRVSVLADDSAEDELEEEFEDELDDELDDEDDLDDEDEDDLDDLDDLDEEDDELEASDDLDADDLDDDLDPDDIDELEDDLSAVVRTNGAAQPTRGAEAVARQLEQRVLGALKDEPVLGERPIEIAVVGDGVVELTGSVYAIDEVSRAAALARRVPGVNMVLNRIEVRMGGHLDTASIPRDPSAPDREAPQG